MYLSAYFYVLDLVRERNRHQSSPVKNNIFQNFSKFTGNTCAGVSILINLLLAVLKKKTTAQVISCISRDQASLYNCFWIEHKQNSTKMIQINVKYNYTLPHFIRFSKQMFLFIAVENYIYKQPYRCSSKFCKIHKKTTVQGQLF